MPKPKRKFMDPSSNEDYAMLGIEYYNKKDAIKTLDSQCKEIRVPLEKFIETSGKTLPNGSKLAVISHVDVDVHLKKTLRVSNVLLPGAVDILRAEGLDKCVEMQPVVREDIVEAMYKEGTISDELLRKIYTPKESFAFSVDVKSKMPDAPET